MIDRLRSILKTDGLVANAAVFPGIDGDRIARELRLEAEGKKRGSSGLPPADQASLDGNEMSAISRIEEIRRKGLENYALNREAYAQRLRSASDAYVEVNSIAQRAKGDYTSEVKAFRGQMTKLVYDVFNWHKAVGSFQKRHKIDRPAYPRGSILVAATVLIACVLVETVLNGYLFAQKNELGLLGGAMVAGLVSIVNVGISTVSGLFSRLVRHRNILAMFSGLLIILAWVGLTFGLNLAVAHFRDAVETLGTWSVAASTSLEMLLVDPFGLRSIESWLLMAWGCLIALVAFLKFVYFGEPYPGYQRITARRDLALRQYADMLEDAVISLKESRDAAVDDLQDASQIVQEKIGDAIDALYGHRMMKGHLQAFLEQCDVKANALLSIYRDANRASRSNAAPKHFSEVYRFAPYQEPELDTRAREDAKQEAVGVREVVKSTIGSIHEDFAALLKEYPEPNVLIGIDLSTGESVIRNRLLSTSLPDDTDQLFTVNQPSREGAGVAADPEVAPISISERRPR